MVDLLADNLEWSRGVARSVRAHLPAVFDLADLEQAAAVALWRAALRFDPARGVPFRSFALPAVRGACLMAVRRRAWRDAMAGGLDSAELSRLPAAALDVDAALDADRLALHLRGLIRSLPARERAVVRAHYLEGRPMREVASGLGACLSTAYRLRALGLARLRADAGAPGAYG